MRNALLLAFLFPLAAFAQLDHAREVTKTLCSPDFHGRGYVNGGDSIAAEYVAAQLKTAGCRFFKGKPFQSFAFDVNTFPGKMEVAINGNTLRPGIDYVVDPGSGGGTAQNLQIVEFKLETVLNGEALASMVQQLRKQSFTDKAFLFNLSGLKGDSLKQMSQLSAEMTRHAAVICVVSEKFTWSVDHEATPFPFLRIQQSAFDNTQTELRLSYTIDQRIVQHTARNVIAYVPAKRRSKKYLVFTAHYDHLGRMGQATYFPGGNDNASGTAMLIELAAYFAQHPLEVNVVFIAFAGEEAGLIGSHHYVDHPLFPLNRIAFLANVDIMGSGEDGVTVVNATLFPEQFKQLTDINTNDQLLKKVASRGPAANSDHYFFTQAGVPAFFLYTMGPNKNYHDVYDTYEALSFNEFADIEQLLIRFAEGMRLARK